MSSILFARAPGLLAHAAARLINSPTFPLAVVDGRSIRDACPRSAAEGVAAGMPLRSAKVRCPLLATVPLEPVDARPETEQFLSALADRLPYSAIEPSGPDAAFVALALPASPDDVLDVATVVAVGPSRNAARALAEYGGLPQDRLGDCDARWLWPEDEAVTARLFRLGLTTYGDVAALPEEVLAAQFGAKIGRQLHLRSHGRDLTPVRALYPPPPAEASRDYAMAPIQDEAGLRFAISRLADAVSRQLRAADRIARRMRLVVAIEEMGEREISSALIRPAQDVESVAAAALRLRAELSVTGPVTALRLAAVETEPATAMTANLFGQRQAAEAVALKACRHALTTRYGPRALRTGAERDRAEGISPRTRRRRANLEAARRAGAAAA